MAFNSALTTNPKTLIVDDDEYNRRVLLSFMERYSTDISLVGGGKDAIDFFSDAMEEGAPYKVVLLDIMMPDINGQTVLRKLRGIEEEHQVHTEQEAKIIMISAVDEVKRHTDRALLRGGMNTAFLSKPLNVQMLVEKLMIYGIIHRSALL